MSIGNQRILSSRHFNRWWFRGYTLCWRTHYSLGMFNLKSFQDYCSSSFRCAYYLKYLRCGTDYCGKDENNSTFIPKKQLFYIFILQKIDVTVNLHFLHHAISLLFRLSRNYESFATVHDFLHRYMRVFHQHQFRCTGWRNSVDLYGKAMKPASLPKMSIQRIAGRLFTPNIQLFCARKIQEWKNKLSYIPLIYVYSRRVLGLKRQRTVMIAMTRKRASN